MRYDEYIELNRKTLEDECSYFCIDRSKKRDQRRYFICNEDKNTYLECTPETKPF